MNPSKQDTYLKDWQAQEAMAEQMLPVLGSLYRDKNIVMTVYGRSLMHCTAIDILKVKKRSASLTLSRPSLLRTQPGTPERALRSLA